MKPSSTCWQSSPLSLARPVPWRNGGGTTRELATWPDAQAWRWRISVAEIAQDGPFSRFEGVERQFAVLSGAGVVLSFGDQRHVLTPADAPLGFSGDTPCDCRLLEGPTLDFNVMTQGMHARLERRPPGTHHFSVESGQTVGVYALEPVQLFTPDETLALPAHTLSWRVATQPFRLEVTGGSFLAWALAPLVVNGGPA
jgi:environmental stress-induced protein Ves